MFHITATDLEDWSTRIVSESELPRLISCLVWATTSGLVTLDMPVGEHVRLPGYDGIVECAAGDDMVPEGASVWEFSVNGDIATKANSDYNKRTAKPGNVNRKSTAFVFATSMRWAKGRDWATAKKETGEWRDVRVLSSQHLEQWLSRVPWIAAQFAPIIKNTTISGIESLEMIWNDYKFVPNNELLPSFVIGDRPSAGKLFLEWLRADVPESDRIICMTGPSEKEIFHYIAATIYSLPVPDPDAFGARIFAVHDKFIARSLGHLESHNIILVTKGDAVPAVVATAKRNGCRVVIVRMAESANPAAPHGLKELILPMLPQENLVKSLIRLGRFTNTDDAIRFCEQCNFEYEKVRAAIFFC